MKIPRILITSGEPAGVGPDLVAQVAQDTWPAELCVIGDRELLLARAEQLKLRLTLHPFDAKIKAAILPPGHLRLIPIMLKQPCRAGKLNPENAPYVQGMLEIAAQAAQDKAVDALVTGPVNKAIMNDAGLRFLGHTEFFAEKAGIKMAVMLFVVQSIMTRAWMNGELKVALVTTHLPLAKVPQAITPEVLEETLRILRRGLVGLFKLKDPTIYVCGLNPHAGEGGYLGREEIEVIEPVLDKLRGEGIQLRGPLPADTVFTEKYLQEADAILAMFHDQALSVVKTLGFGRAVNLTLGLPYIRTSVDHGTALDVAGTAGADPSSLKSAIKLAIELAS